MAEVPREAFLAFCDEVARLDEDALVERFRLPPVRPRRSCRRCSSTGRCLSTAARRWSSPTRRCGPGCCSTWPSDGTPEADFGPQVLASAEALGESIASTSRHAQHVALLATRLFDELPAEHGLDPRDRLLLQVAALLHDIGIYVSLRAHHKHSQYLLAASRDLRPVRDETAIVSNIARYHRRGLPQQVHLPYMRARSRRPLLIVEQAGGDSARSPTRSTPSTCRRCRDLQRLREDDGTWMLELDGAGDLTMEQLAATARADMFVEMFGASWWSSGGRE